MHVGFVLDWILHISCLTDCVRDITLASLWTVLDLVLEFQLGMINHVFQASMRHEL